MDGAHNALLDLEEVLDSELEAARANYLALARQAKSRVKRGVDDTRAAEIKSREPKAELDPRVSVAND